MQEEYGVSIRKQADLASDGHLLSIATLADFVVKGLLATEDAKK